MKAANLTNGHFLYEFVEEDGSQRKALYRCNQSNILPDNLTERTLGSKRSRKAAGLASAESQEQALQVHYVRDYAFTETMGGTKGEKSDYLLIEGGDKTKDKIG